MMNKNKIVEFAKLQGYSGVEYLNKWHGYDCYEPLFSEDAEVSYIGLPFMIMVKGETIRMSTAEEAMQHIEESNG